MATPEPALDALIEALEHLVARWDGDHYLDGCAETLRDVLAEYSIAVQPELWAPCEGSYITEPRCTRVHFEGADGVRRHRLADEARD